VDVSVDLEAGFTHYASDQTMTSFEQAPGGAVSDATAFATSPRCVASPTPLCNLVAQASKLQSSKLEQLRLGTTVTATILDATDVGVGGAYYIYDQGQPDTAGFYEVSAGASLGAYGAGMPLIPPRWSVRPEIAQRFGRVVTARVWYQYAAYASSDVSTGHTVGAKLQLRTGNFRPYVTGSWRADVGLTDTATTWILGAGLTYAYGGS
jgi:hypothetical protein